MTVRYRRAAGAKSRKVGAALFLANAKRGTLYRVSSSVAALWNLLAHPADAKEILGVFHAAFPSVPLRGLRADVAAMIRDLVSEGLLERVASPRPTRQAKPKRPGR